MNEVTRVHLGRQPFTIAIDAHKVLKAYLAAIEKHVGKNAPEVIEEVELRIAELLLERGVTGDKTVLVSDIAFIEAQLGSPADFGDNDESVEVDSETAASATAKRLFRDTEQGVLGGVASGVAAYFDIDVTFVRIAFIALTLLWGGGLVLYLIMWLIVPEAKTGSDHLQLRGKPITVESIKEFVGKADVPRQASRAQTVVRPLIQKVGRVITLLIGLGFMFGAAITALWTIGFGIYAWIAPERLTNAGDIFPQEGLDYVFMAAIATAVVSVCVLVFLAGLALIRRRKVVPGWMTGSIMALIFAAIAVGFPLGFKVIPDAADRYNATEQTQTRSLEAFTNLRISDQRTTVQYVPSSAYKVEIKTLGEINNKAIETSVKDGTLQIVTGDYQIDDNCALFCVGNEWPEITVYAPMLSRVEVRDNATFRSERQLQQDTLEVQTDGTVTLRMHHIDAASASLTVDGLRKTLMLTGLSRSASESDVMIADSYQGSITLMRADAVEIMGAKECIEDSPHLYLVEIPKSLTIDSQVYASEKLRDDTSDDDRPSAVHCIEIDPEYNYYVY